MLYEDMRNEMIDPTGQITDVIVVGAGPAGLACALEAKARGLGHLVIDKGTLVNAIVGFPVAMTFFSTPELLELGGMPFTSPNVRPNRIETVEYYHGVARNAGLHLELHNRVNAVTRDAGVFTVSTDRGEYRARHVVLATGYFDHVNPLGVPGEELPHVSHYYHEPYGHFGQDVLVIGGRNSAVETALDLYRHGARVTMIHRGDAFHRGLKYWVRPDIENRLARGEITMHWNTEVSAITERSAMLRSNVTGESFEIPVQAVYALTGYRPDTTLLAACGVRFHPETLIPEFDPATFETNVPDLYIAGSVACGAKTWEIFIENGRQHAAAVVAEIARRAAGNAQPTA